MKGILSVRRFFNNPPFPGLSFHGVMKFLPPILKMHTYINLFVTIVALDMEFRVSRRAPSVRRSEHYEGNKPCKLER